MIPTMLLNMANWMSLIMVDQVLSPQSEIGTLVNYFYQIWPNGMYAASGNYGMSPKFGLFKKTFTENQHI